MQRKLDHQSRPYASPKNSQKKDAFIPSRRCVFFRRSPDTPKPQEVTRLPRARRIPVVVLEALPAVASPRRPRGESLARLSLFGRPSESSNVGYTTGYDVYICKDTCIYIYIYIYLHTSLYDYLQASTKVHVHVRLGELTIAAVALDEGAKPAAGSCFHNDWEAGFLVPVTWFQTC